MAYITLQPVLDTGTDQDQGVWPIVPDDLHQCVQRFIVEVGIQRERASRDDDGERLALQLRVLKLCQLGRLRNGQFARMGLHMSVTDFQLELVKVVRDFKPGLTINTSSTTNAPPPPFFPLSATIPP